MSKSWREQQAENARIMARRQKARLDAESEQARGYLQRFVSAAQRDGLSAQPLLVRGYGAKGHARTELRGWYLKADHSMAVSEAGDFYLLIAELTWKERLWGTHPQPSDPPLVLGAGGRDGEAIDLTAALTKLLPTWRTDGQ